MAKGFVLIVRNVHIDSCGSPPYYKTKPGLYTGYFENLYGEQWIFSYDIEKDAATLQGGDSGWGNKHRVLDGEVPTLILGDGETMWLAACWEVVKSLKRVRGRPLRYC